MTDRDWGPVPTDDLETGDERTRVFDDIGRDDFVRYAGASGDFNPIHYDDPYARDAGYESVFGHGMLTAGYVATTISDWLGPDRIGSFTIRFRGKVYPGTSLTITAEVTNKSIDGDCAVVEVAISGRDGDGETVATGTATATLPRGDRDDEQA